MSDCEDLVAWLRRRAGDALESDRLRLLQAADVIQLLDTVIELRNDLRLEELSAHGRA